MEDTGPSSLGAPGGALSEELASAEARIRDLEAALEIAELKLGDYEDRQGARARAHAELQRSEHRFQALIEGLHVGVVIQGPSSEILLYNARALQLLGLTEDEIHGRSSFDPAWKVIHEDGRPYEPEERPVAVVLTTREAVRGVVMGIERPRHNDVIWLLVNALPECDSHGDVVQVVATMDDITERKRLEDSLRQAQKLDSLGLLAGGIAHDFNNLLTVITSCTELAQLSIPKGSEAAEELEEVLSASGRATGLTRQLLSFARRQVISPQRIDAGEAAQDLRKLLGRLLGSEHALELHCEERPATVRVDRGQFEQVLVNFVINARDAMPEGGTITVTVRSFVPGAAPTELGELGDRATIAICVHDQGVGMSAEVVDRIFEPFFTTKPLGRGTGLGLATVHGIIRQAGGQIRVHSTLGVGSEFCVYLPKEAISPGASPVPGAPEEADGTGQTVLIVDDEVVLRTVVGRMLTDLGYQTLTASDGYDALDQLETHGDTIALLLSDVVMPRMGGVELAHRVRQRWPAIRVILSSGYAQVQGDDDLPVIADATLPKPYNRSTLARIVRKTLQAT